MIIRNNKINLIIKILIIFFFNSIIKAQIHNDIVMLVDKIPITSQQIDERTKLIMLFNNIQDSNLAKDIAINTLTNEQLILNEAQKYKLSISNQELNDAISNIEKKRNLPPGLYRNILKEKNIDFDTFARMISCEFFKEKILQNLASTIQVSDSDLINYLSHNFPEHIEINAKIFITDKNFSFLNKLKTKNLSSIKKINYPKNISIEDFYGKLNKFNYQSIAESINENSSSGVLLYDNKYLLIFIDKKQIANLSDEKKLEYKNNIFLKKLDVEAKKYFDSLRKKSNFKKLK